MANALGAGGGFCVGSKEVVDHQRLSSNAYVFSASLPSVLTVAAMSSLKLLDDSPSKFIGPLRENTQVMRSILSAIPGVMCLGAEVSPVMHLRLKDRLATRDEEEFLLQDVVEEVMISSVSSFFLKFADRVRPWVVFRRRPRMAFLFLAQNMCRTRLLFLSLRSECAQRQRLRRRNRRRQLRASKRHLPRSSRNENNFRLVVLNV